MEQIILGFSKDETAAKIARMFGGSGYKILSNCPSKAELIRTAHQFGNCFVIMGFKLSDATVNEVFEDLPQGIPLISLLKPEQQLLISYEDILVVPLPINQAQMLAALEVFNSRLQKSYKPQRSEDDTKIIGLAKHLLMEKHRMTEKQAHRFIQKQSMDAGVKFVDGAKFILSELGVWE